MRAIIKPLTIIIAKYTKSRKINNKTISQRPMQYLLTFFTCLVVISTLLPLSNNTHWIVRSMDFPRLQLATLAFLTVIIQALVLDLTQVISWVLMSITLCCLAWQISWILPYTSLWKKKVRHCENDNLDSEISILTSNVLATNRNASALIKLVQKHQPDILVTLESTKWWEEQLQVIEADMPNSIKCPLDNLYGMHVYSRLPLENEQIEFLIEDNIPSIHTTIVLRTGDKIRTHFLHPAPPSPTENTESTERDVELILVAKSLADTTQPVIVTGDLNDVAWSKTTHLFREISGLLDPRIGRGMFNTFHADYPFFRWPLDHIFHSHHFELRDIQRLPSIGSDHFPLLTKLSFNPQKDNNQTIPNARPSGIEKANNIADKKPADKSDVPNPIKD